MKKFQETPPPLEGFSIVMLFAKMEKWILFVAKRTYFFWITTLVTESNGCVPSAQQLCARLLAKWLLSYLIYLLLANYSPFNKRIIEMP